ncbi:Flp pilus assembly complex ATPase component TadA [Bradyrhizobium diazoefficiens]|uniref:GspE/PulE family protein n=1 Tax=Bradyrhizobium diazoefficiens TaxID=1355477 RepID=UPI00190B9F8E|nr:ATPase, T2SS/T4P/T4SS family [Bradyrhizobium diazoefficiens]MBK3665376.1 Flp pilus assembly complex ATPase component TadA [Bradyrhizobium diazoefficiens]
MPSSVQELLRHLPEERGAGPPPQDPNFAEAFTGHLVAEGILDRGAVARARRAAEAASERIDAVLVKLGLVSEVDLCSAYASYCALPVVGPGDIPARPILAEQLGLTFLKTSRSLPLALGRGSLLLAVVDPFDDEARRSISYMLGIRVDLAVIAPADIERAFRNVYQDQESASQADDEQVTAIGGNEGNEPDVERLRDIANEAPIIRLVNQIISRAVERGASDVHVEPGRDEVAVRIRLDGFLRPERSVPATLRAALTTRIKIMAKLDIAERRLPQDGRIKTAVRGSEVDIRVSTIPTAFGESLVLRILDRTRVELEFEKLGLDKTTEENLHRLMALPNGLLLVTGPTGSGKTTTLYTALKHLNRPELKVFTVEDPIEYQLAGINQIHVQPQIGLDFPSALRAILRQDPDVIMVGEIRDIETARIAVQAALTGHLVFSTLHTNGALAAITRLIDIGLERYLLASTVSGVMAQRLVRRLCRHCSRRYVDFGGIPARLTLAASDGMVVDWSDSREAVGCEACGGIGYSGRTTVSELLVVNDDVRQAIGRRSGDQLTLENLARTAGFVSLYENGLMKVAAGETTLDEVLRVTRTT